ncbi:hypothetical protein [Sporosarcina sp. FSL W7-1283]|uniref:hypothetical protein n=1 Tax=Sporosarcina sp. FSL W7-1283 TaxID=2921560 RepID=UPI0030F80139
MSLFINIFRTVALAMLYNVPGYWIAKVVIHFNLAIKVYTEFGTKYMIISVHIAVATIATMYAFIHARRDSE